MRSDSVDAAEAIMPEGATALLIPKPSAVTSSRPVKRIFMEGLGVGVRHDSKWTVKSSS